MTSQCTVRHRENVMGYNKELAILGSEGYDHTHPLWLREGSR